MIQATDEGTPLKCISCGTILHTEADKRDVVCFMPECGLYDHYLTRSAYKVLSDMRDKITNQKAALKEAIEWIDDGTDSGDLRPSGGFIDRLYDVADGKEKP